MDTEIKAVLDGAMKTFEEFKSANDQTQAELKKLGSADVVLTEKVERLGKAVDDQIDATKKLVKHAEEVEAKFNRSALGGGAPDGEAKSAAEFGRLIDKADFNADSLRQYKADFDEFMRKDRKSVTLSVGSDPSGGYWVLPDVSGRMVKKIYESSPMRQIASVVNIGTDAIEGPIDNGQFEARWVGEKVARTQTDASQIGKWRIDVNELYAYPLVTQKLLDDAVMPVESWISEKAASQFALKETTAFYTGSGSEQPMGMLNYAFVATDDKTRSWGKFQYIPTGASGAFAASSPADCLVDLIFSLKAAYRPNARFQMSRSTMGAVRKLKDGQGNYLVDLRLRDGALVETIFGFPNVDAEDMPAIAANSYSIGFGDWRETYTIVDRLGVSVVRDNVTQPGYVKFNFRKRLGGGAINFESAKFLKFAAS